MIKLAKEYIWKILALIGVQFVGLVLIVNLLAGLSSDPSALQEFMLKKSLVDNLVYLGFSIILYSSLRREVRKHANVSFIKFFNTIFLWFIWVLIALCVIILFLSILVSVFIGDLSAVNDWMKNIEENQTVAWLMAISIRVFFIFTVLWMALTLATQLTSTLIKSASRFYVFQQHKISIKECLFGAWDSVSAKEWKQISVALLILLLCKVVSSAAVHYGQNIGLMISSFSETASMVVQFLLYVHVLRVLISSRYLFLLRMQHGHAV